MRNDIEILPECPFFRDMGKTFILCEGVDGHSFLKLGFRRERFLKHHGETFCCSMNYENCPLARMHYKRYGCDL